eukprot:COSAG02_NODE_1071_length_14802_cov_5.546419_4_plen_118_part_00
MLLCAVLLKFIISQKQLLDEFGLKRPSTRAALIAQLPLFVLGHSDCNNDGGDKHLHTYKREELQLPCSKVQLEREEAANVHYAKLVKRKKALKQSALVNKRKFDETGVEVDGMSDSR